MGNRLVLLRHGQSIWNSENRFTGWTDVDLTDKGIAEAKRAGQILREAGYTVDVAYTSVLKRAIKTLWLVLDELDLCWLPVRTSWRLNERHYGALQGLDKAETAARYGVEVVHSWRRSYAVRPPALEPDDPRFPSHDRRYQAVPPGLLPRTESLKDTVERLLPCWHEAIAPAVAAGQGALVVAHGNSLRAFVKFLDGVPDEDVPSLAIPTGIPLVYEFDADLRPVTHTYIGSPEEIARAVEKARRAARVGPDAPDTPDEA
mgnify:CR=1 FL=1